MMNEELRRNLRTTINTLSIEARLDRTTPAEAVNLAQAALLLAQTESELMRNARYRKTVGPKLSHVDGIGMVETD